MSGALNLHLAMSLLNAVNCNLTELITKSILFTVRVFEIVMHASGLAYIRVPLCPAVFCQALAPVHLSGVCVPLCFALFVCVPVPVHALS